MKKQKIIVKTDGYEFEESKAYWRKNRKVKKYIKTRHSRAVRRLLKGE